MSETKGREAKDYLRLPYGRVITPESDGSFRGEIIEFPGCLSVGDTANEACVNLEIVAESWLLAVLANGQSVPPPTEQTEYSGKFVLRLPKSLHRKATLIAAREGVSLNQFIVASLAEAIGGHP